MWDRDYMYECDIIRLTTYIENRPKSSLLKASSYSDWALNEILDRVAIETMKLPYHISGMEPQSIHDIVKEFIDEMEYFSTIVETEELTFLTLIAKQEAEKLLVEF